MIPESIKYKCVRCGHEIQDDEHVTILSQFDSDKVYDLCFTCTKDFMIFIKNKLPIYNPPNT